MRSGCPPPASRQEETAEPDSQQERRRRLGHGPAGADLRARAQAHDPAIGRSELVERGVQGGSVRLHVVDAGGVAAVDDPQLAKDVAPGGEMYDSTKRNLVAPALTEVLKPGSMM